jgi:hypothetical protein
VHNIELKAYASLIRSALDQGIRQLQDRKTKPVSWWGAAAAQDRERKRAAADTLLTDKTIKGIYALRFIAKQQETNPNQAYITWLITKIEELYRTNWDLFELLRGDLFKTATFKYVYNQLFIIGYRGTAPTAISVGARADSTSNAEGIITTGQPSPATDADTTRDISLRSPQYNPIPIAQIPTDPLIQQEFPDALKATDAAPKPASAEDAAEDEPGTALANDEIEALVQLDDQEGQDIWFFGQRPLKLPTGAVPKDWRERPIYRKISDQLNLINYAKQASKGDDWINTIFDEVNKGCTSDRRIMFSTKCPTFRTYLEQMTTYSLGNMGDFKFTAPETPDAESYGNVTLTLLVDLSSLTRALEDDADIAAAPEELKPIKKAMQQIQDRLKALTAAPTLASIQQTMTSLQAQLAALLAP